MIASFLATPLTDDVGRALARLARAPGVRRIAVMPDVHLAHTVCVGTVVATEGVVYPAAVGGDIGCGVATVRLDGVASALTAARAAMLLGSLARLVPVQRHPRSPPMPDGLAPRPPSGCVSARVVAAQLGTLGRGNHFIELQADAADRLWLMVHSGSRGAGQAIRAAHAPPAALVGLPVDGSAGRAYLADLAWARAYARANRAALLTAAAAAAEVALGCAPVADSVVDCDHNHVRAEVHESPFWVHRKGAIRAELGTPGLIPGSMGSASYHTLGRGLPEALCSSSHGAGRVMDRATARRRITPSAIEAQLAGVYFDHRRADRLVDEAPAAYREIGVVMRAQRALTRIVREVRPLLSFKGA